jgi:hypothetical protein
VALFTDLGDANYLDYAIRHREVIRQFGRFPHRNAILGRVSTPAEIDVSLSTRIKILTWPVAEQMIRHRKSGFASRCGPAYGTPNCPRLAPILLWSVFAGKGICDCR